jgi:hypothetical protein
VASCLANLEYAQPAAAITALLVYSNLMYYLRGFKATGPMLRTISQVISDMVPFLCVNLVMLLGFSTAFFALYGPAWEDSIQYHSGEESPAPFSTVGSTIARVFGMFVGDFDPQDFYLTNDPAWVPLAFGLFGLYMVLVSVVCFNLLIAILSESYDRVQSRPEYGAEVSCQLHIPVFRIADMLSNQVAADLIMLSLDMMREKDWDQFDGARVVHRLTPVGAEVEASTQRSVSQRVANLVSKKMATVDSRIVQLTTTIQERHDEQCELAEFLAEKLRVHFDERLRLSSQSRGDSNDNHSNGCGGGDSTIDGGGCGGGSGNCDDGSGGGGKRPALEHSTPQLVPARPPTAVIPRAVDEDIFEDAISSDDVDSENEDQCHIETPPWSHSSDGDANSSSDSEERFTSSDDDGDDDNQDDAPIVREEDPMCESSRGSGAFVDSSEDRTQYLWNLARSPRLFK